MCVSCGCLCSAVVICVIVDAITSHVAVVCCVAVYIGGIDICFVVPCCAVVRSVAVGFVAGIVRKRQT